MRIVVQKYGGTSVNTPVSRQMIIKNLIDAKKNGLSPVVVVSAMGRKPAPYATDSLLSLLPDDAVNANSRSKDLLVSCGEIITTVVVAEEMALVGIDAVPLTGGQAGILVEETYGEGNIISIDNKRILKYLEEDVVPVVAGFQGMSKNHEIVTLGRGGSDITATALGAALEAEVVEIYTDVDGVMTADPRVVDSASLIDRIDYEEVFRLAELGAKVIHPRAVEFAMEANVPIAVLNTSKGREQGGTIIDEYSYDITKEKEKPFHAVTQLDNNSQVNIRLTDIKKEDILFKTLAEKNVSIDMINIFPDKKTFIIADNKAEQVTKIMNELKLDFEITSGFSKITVMGRINGVPGVVAKIISNLYSNGIYVYQSSDSSTVVSVLVKTEEAKKAVQILHKALIDE